jgi:hypothetical protein
MVIWQFPSPIGEQAPSVAIPAQSTGSVFCRKEFLLLVTFFRQAIDKKPNGRAVRAQ